MDAPNIESIRAERGRKLTITWRGGGQNVVDTAPYLAEYTIFARLRSDDAAFRAVRVGEWGWSAHWTDDMEISSDTLWRLALEQGRGS